jgi:serine/threonine protein kinase
MPLSMSGAALAASTRPAVIATDAPREKFSPLEPGEVLAPGYVVITHLHRGDVLDVYDVWSEERACRCIAKALRPDARESASARRGLLREGRLLLRLTHPHIVRAYGVLPDLAPIIILETLPGETLEWLVLRRGAFPVGELAYLGLHLCAALTYLHRQEILHLDLTPGNIVIGQGVAKILDLSLAQRPGRCRGGMGTPGFRAPEQAVGGMLTTATDIYGLAAVLAFAMTGQERGEPEHFTISNAHESVAGSSWDERMPATLWVIIDACLDPEPRHRPDLAALARILGEFVPHPGDSV